MRYAVVDTVYQGYVNHLYQGTGLHRRDWAAQYRATVDGGFPTLSSWSEPLEAKGHTVLDLWANHMPLQHRWCVENGALDLFTATNPPVEADAEATPEAFLQPWAQTGFVEILREQIRRFRPDVLVIGNLFEFDTSFLRSIAGHYGVAIGQHAAAIPWGDHSGYQAIISSLPNQVRYFTGLGLDAYEVRLAFDRRLLRHLKPGAGRFGLIFPGQVTDDHGGRARTLRALATAMDVDVFSDSAAPLGADTRARLHPALWGLEMYQAMRDSRMVFNCHIDAAGEFANNLRLYEASGSGSLLLTDAKVNMDRILVPGRECLAFESPEDAVRLAQHYLAHEDERRSIAEAGTARVMREHTYHHRVEELIAVAERYL